MYHFRPTSRRLANAKSNSRQDTSVSPPIQRLDLTASPNDLDKSTKNTFRTLPPREIFAPQPRRVASPELIFCSAMADQDVDPDSDNSMNSTCNPARVHSSPTMLMATSSSQGSNLSAMWEDDEDEMGVCGRPDIELSSLPTRRADNPVILDSRFNTSESSSPSKRVYATRASYAADNRRLSTSC